MRYILTVVFLFTANLTLLASERVTISVMNLNVTTGLAQNEVLLLTDKLLNGFVSCGVYTVVERSKRDEILKEQGFQQSGACDQGGCLVEAGQLLGVQKMVGGTIGRLGLKYAVELRVMDVKTGEIDRAFSRTYTGDVSALLDAMTEAAILLSAPTNSDISVSSALHQKQLGLTYIKTNDKGFKEYQNEKDGSILIEIPSGDFRMGCNDGSTDERPAHTVHLDGYFIGKYELTLGQFRKFCAVTGYILHLQPDWNTSDNQPVVNVGSDDAKAYCDWAGLRLPTEAEWERAASGDSVRRYPWGDDWIDGKCNNSGRSDTYQYTAPVDAFADAASPFGVLNMAGNVEEWCADWYGIYYYASSQKSNPTGPESPSEANKPLRVVRGGSWDANRIRCRTTARKDVYYKDCTNDRGVRVAK